MLLLSDRRPVAVKVVMACETKETSTDFEINCAIVCPVEINESVWDITSV